MTDNELAEFKRNMDRLRHAFDGSFWNDGMRESVAAVADAVEGFNDRIVKLERATSENRHLWAAPDLR
jgi:uncharacterized protein (DUF2164 family)